MFKSINVTNAVVIDKKEIEEKIDSMFLELEESIAKKEEFYYVTYILGFVRVYHNILGINEKECPRFLTIARMIKHAYDFDIMGENEE